ncbi:protein of unknown function [Candidatus Filomicrobium marinum]|uniref:Uncharacterized protein n=1 Tax=Candidatus Filomicrobium marinum TaxID=1608628 RepID=A0A0D6JKB9_9HYPH|nr:protein of unknown function [Candidatus Filomicrobium marinum]CPR22147.1 protein of unknown function [Candidatus Filomicrobium marinum]
MGYCGLGLTKGNGAVVTRVAREPQLQMALRWPYPVCRAETISLSVRRLHHILKAAYVLRGITCSIS